MMLTPAQTLCLQAAAGRIVPADEFPSATEAGALRYIERLLNRDLPQRWPDLTEGLDRLDAAAGERYQTSFPNLSSDQQDALLAAQETSADPEAGAFFTWLVEMVLESYYADPANGGNTDAVSWKMIGYEPRVPGYNGEARR